jgi:hypothetical protein
MFFWALLAVLRLSIGSNTAQCIDRKLAARGVFEAILLDAIFGRRSRLPSEQDIDGKISMARYR